MSSIRLINKVPLGLIVVLLFMLIQSSHSQGDGFLHVDDKVLFPIGMYELPDSEQGLREMADAGINIVRCHSPKDLDRVYAAGLLGWIPLPVQGGATESLRELIASVTEHPALALWEGPDEVVWNFTAYSGLEKSAGIKREDWWGQRPNAVGYAAGQAEKIIPNIRDGIGLVRRLDKKERQFWINEARSSDPVYVRQYLPFIDITGCDDYPVRTDSPPQEIARIGPSTQRWVRIGNGKPVYVVLQAFAWTELNKETANQEHTYPSFDQSRFMAYDAIVRGARGLMYWGSQYLTSKAFRKSLYALTAELSALQPFLTTGEESGVLVRLLEGENRETAGVKITARRFGREWLVILVNEDNQRHMGVEVSGLAPLNGYSLVRLYGDEQVKIEDGQFLTRMTPLAVKVFATGRRWELIRDGRRFIK